MRTYAHYWANTGSKIHMNTTFDQHYNDIKNGASTENVERDYVSPTLVPEWLKGIVPFETIDTTQTIESSNTGFVITGGDISSQVQILPGGDTCSFNVNLPRNWDTLVANEGYKPIGNYNLSK